MIIYLRQAPENRYDIVCEFVYQFLRIFGGGFGRCEVLGQRGRDLTDVTFINEKQQFACGRYLRNECLQWCKDILVEHLRANIETAVDT